MEARLDEHRLEDMIAVWELTRIRLSQDISETSEEPLE